VLRGDVWGGGGAWVGWGRSDCTFGWAFRISVYILYFYHGWRCVDFAVSVRNTETRCPAAPRLHTAPFRPLPYIYCRLRYYHINQPLHARLLRSPPLLSLGIQSPEFEVVSTIVWILIPTLPCLFIDIVFTAGSGTTLRFPSQHAYQSSSCPRHRRSASRRKRG
jgi:hypothetical protein